MKTSLTKKWNFLLLILCMMSISACNFEASSSFESEDISKTEQNIDSVSSSESNKVIDEDEELIKVDTIREDRNLSMEAVSPKNVKDTSVMWKVASSRMSQTSKTLSMSADNYTLTFINTLGSYHPLIKVDNETIYQINNPVKLYLKKTGQIEYNYDSVLINEYGILATCKISTAKGSIFEVEDQYYYPKDESISNAINVQRLVKVVQSNKNEAGFESIYSINTMDDKTDNLEWFMPNQVFGSYEVTGSMNYKIYRETLMGLPLVMMRNKENGVYVSLSRYQPIIDNSTNSFACLELHQGSNSIGDKNSSIEVCYPTRDSSRKYFEASDDNQIVYDLTIQVGKTSDFDEAMINVYNNQYTLENPRIVNTDIDEVYKVINKDFKEFFQSNKENGVTSYGLPWTVTIENGHFGGKSYQSGFVGQQIPCAYNMMVYGLKYNDKVSLKNGMKIINFWVNDAKMMTSAGVPMIWYNGQYNCWASYPTFLRMAIDTMEGLLDAYRLAEAYGLATTNWKESLIACANWLIKAQNNDGSWYRCYNYQGTYYKGNESDIGWNPGDICRSTSKNNSTMPIRFLAKMYEFTNEKKYYDACIKASDFIYQNLYPKHCYYGGTCDNPDAMDKEAGVYAMYAYDTLYTLTKDEKWLKCLEQAITFTMSTVLTIGYKINADATDLKASLYAKYGYTDGLSFICCGGSAVDNYIAYIYYELFRAYIYTSKEVYYNMAEFIQQNTKSSMDWDGTLGYSYKSLTPEASTVYNFNFSSAKDDEGLQGCWLPWQSAANAEPIAKMYEVFGKADVAKFKDYDIATLKDVLDDFGVGGKNHKKY